MRATMREMVVILENIRSAHNVGSVFRTADGAGVSRIVLAGYTPSPVDRFERPVPEITKTSLGATETLSWEQREDVTSCIRELKREGYHIVAVEQSPGSVSLYDYDPKAYEKIAYVFGNEVDGVSREAMEMADTILEIPMHGKKESLNVSVTAGIVLFHNLL